MPQAYNISNPMERFDKAYDRVRGFRQDDAYQAAGNALTSGDYAGASNALYGEGLLKEGEAVEDRAARQAEAASKLATDKQQAAAKYLTESMANLRRLHDEEPDPGKRKAKVLQGFDFYTPRLRALDESEEEIGQLRAQLEADPDTTLTLMGTEAAKEAGLDIVKGSDGSYVAVDRKTGRPAYKFRAPQTTKLGEGEQLLEIPGSEGVDGAPPAPTAPVPAPPVPPAANADTVRSVVDGLTRAGAKITSGQRSSQHNAAVGGAKNSYHLTGHAYDIVPPPGMSMSQLEQQLRSTGVKFSELINEGDHVHIAWGNEAPPAAAPTPAAQSAPGVRVIASRPAKPKERDAPSGYQYQADGSLTFIRGGPADPSVQATTNAKNTRKAAADFRKEFNARPEVKDYRTVNTAYNQIKGLFGKAPSAASDIAGIFSYMKMLDPDSVVREGEFATAQNATGVPERVWNTYNKLLKGERLNPKQRNDFLAQAGSIHASRSTRYSELVNEYRGYAQDYDIDPDQIQRLPKAAPSAPARTGPAKYTDAAKEARYQAWLKANAGR